MASLPTFSKSGVTTYTFTKAPFTPHHKPLKQHQNIGISGGNQAKVANKGAATELIQIIMNRISSTSYNNLLTFIQDTNINYSLYTFTYTDVDGNTYTVRFFNTKGIDWPQAKGGLFNVNFTLRVEVL